MEYFLPLTIDRSKWKTDGKLVFLSGIYEAQLSDDEKKTLDYTILPWVNLFPDEHFVESLTEQVMSVLASLLNEHHGVSLSEGFWKRMLRRWTQDLFYIIYDRYTRLQQVREVYPEDSICSVLSDQTPSDFLKVNYGGGYFGDEQYNYLLLSLLAEKYFIVSGVAAEDKAFGDSQDAIARQGATETTVKLGNVNYFRKALYHYYLRKKPHVVYASEFFTQRTVETFAIRSRGKILPLEWGVDAEADTIDTAFRDMISKALNDAIPQEKEWVRAAFYIYPKFLPTIFIESFRKIQDSADQFLAENPQLKAFKTSTCLFGMSPTTFLFQYAKEKLGCTLIDQQHGGGYELSLMTNTPETLASDIFYAYGPWIHDLHSDHCKGMVAPCHKFSNYDDYEEGGQHEVQDYIVYVCNSIDAHLRYGCGWDQIFSGIAPYEYYRRELAFIAGLPDSMKEKLLVRHYMKDYGWHIDQDFEKRYPTIRTAYGMRHDQFLKDTVTRDIEMSQQLKHCKLYMCDYMSTTYLEAMYIDKPMILLIPEQALYRDTEAEYIHALERVGVIQHDPVKAAAYVADVYDRIDEWWKEPERREAVNAVRERYITKVKDTDGWWFRELMKYC